MRQKLAVRSKKACFRLFLIILVTVVAVSRLLPSYCRAEEMALSAQAAVLMDVSTGQVLYAKNGERKMYPASTTKILTGILAIEGGNLEAEVKVSPYAAAQEGSSIWLAPGEVLTLGDLLYGLLLSSGNDAAMAIAEYIGGSGEKFAWMMNTKAREIGAKNSHFTNPHGMPDEEHYTTAYDLALIARYALHNPVFSKVVATKHATIPWPGQKWSRGLRNHNGMLWLYPNADGVKNGYTRAAGRCLVTSATREGRRLVVAVLNSPQDYADTRKLLDYGFSEFEEYTVVEEGEVVREEMADGAQLQVAAGARFTWTVPKGGSAEVRKEIQVQEKLVNLAGYRAGIMKIYIEGKAVAGIPLIVK